MRFSHTVKCILTHIYIKLFDKKKYSSDVNTCI